MNKAGRLSCTTKYLLNLACGPNRKEGWINIDPTDGVDLQLDIRERLPFPDDSVEVICSEHFFEHLNYPGFADSNAFAGLELSGYQSEVSVFLRESYRVLVPGGLFGVGVPDPEQALIAYANRDEQAFKFMPGHSQCL